MNENMIWENGHPQELRGEVLCAEALMDKWITGVGHKPWHEWEKGEPMLIADGELVRVTHDAYKCVKFNGWNVEMWPKTWHDKHCIWHLERRSFESWWLSNRSYPFPLGSSIIDIKRDND